jgi:hypothetical protein
LYKWGERWALASSNAYDVSTMVWSGTKTYVEIFSDLINRLYPKFAEETGMVVIGENRKLLDFSNLDSSKCYTIGFRHHEFHPILVDPEGMWQIQHVLLSSPFEVCEMIPLPCIPVQESVPMTYDSLAELKMSMVDATENALAFIKQGGEVAVKPTSYAGAASAVASAMLSPNAELNYGWILRAKTEEACAYHSIVVESGFMAKVRQLHYELPSKITRHDRSIAKESNIMMTVMTGTHLQYLNMHPEHVDIVANYIEYTEQIVHGVVAKLTNIRAKTIPVLSTSFAKMCYELAKHIDANLKIKNSNIDIIRDWVIIPEHAQFFALAYLKK